jgi:hypothetical protein
MTAQMDWSKWKTAAAVLMLCALCFLAFGGALRCGFVHYDDDQYVVNNPQVLAGLSWSGARWAFTTGHAGNWHPLTWLSLMADTEWCGGEAWGYHATSVLLHALNGVLLFWVLRRWTGRFAWPLIAAALWMVHPLRTESVAWISERKDVLAAFFGLLALGAYGRPAAESTGVNAPGNSKSRMAVVMTFFALSLMAKPTWVTLPFVLLLADAWPLGRISFFVGRFRPAIKAGSPGGFALPIRKVGRGVPAEPGCFRSMNGDRNSENDFGCEPEASAWKLVLEKWPLFLMAVAISAITYQVQHAGGAVRTAAGYSPGVRVANGMVACGEYVRTLFWPVELAVFYPHPGAGIAPGTVWGAGALLMVVTGLAIAGGRRRPWWLMGWLWFLGTLVPMIGLVQVGGAAWADRYSYLPHIGLTVALVWGVGMGIERIPWSRMKTCAGIAVGVAILALLLLSWRQTAVWRSSETLFTHALNVTTQNAMAHGALGFACAVDGRNEEAVEHLQQALALQPDNLRALNNLAWIWATDPAATPRQVDQALRLARRAAELVRHIRAGGGVLEPGVETAVKDTMDKAVVRQQSMARGQPEPPEESTCENHEALKSERERSR